MEEFPGPNVWASRRDVLCAWCFEDRMSDLLIDVVTRGVVQRSGLRRTLRMRTTHLVGTEVIEGYNGPEGGFHRGYRYRDLGSSLFCIYEHIIVLNDI